MLAPFYLRPREEKYIVAGGVVCEGDADIYWLANRTNCVR
jgi:hypothetical protein